jgi:hypothetical protein
MINKLLNSKEVKSDIINMDSSSLFYLLDEIKLEGRKRKSKGKCHKEIRELLHLVEDEICIKRIDGKVSDNLWFGEKMILM